MAVKNTFTPFQLAPPLLQIGFASRLSELKKTHLQDALLHAVYSLDIAALDIEIAELTNPQGLRLLARFALRAEIVFVLPSVLVAQPTLLTYYRTLLGYSQKEFYKSGTGLGAFKTAEDLGKLNANSILRLPELCRFLNLQASALLAGLEGMHLSASFFNELSLLSVGPQLRGGNNNLLGQAGIKEVFALIKDAVMHADPKIEDTRITLINAAGRVVVIEVAADPDIVILEQSPDQPYRPLVAIEVKAGTDVSNIHNRIGEAEKSHLKAKARKFTEFWTIINVANLTPDAAVRQSPTTNKFFTMADLLDLQSLARLDFIAKIVALTGLPAKPVSKANPKQR